MRTLHGDIVTATSAKITSPVYLVHMTTYPAGMGAVGNYHFSSRQLVNWNLDDYDAGRIYGVSLKTTGAEVKIGNWDRAISAIFLQDQAAPTVVHIYVWYNGQAVHKFTGKADSYFIEEEGGSAVRISLIGIGFLKAKWPRERINKQIGCNHLPRSGAKIIFGNDHYTIEAQRE